MARPWKDARGWWTEDFDDRLIGPFKSENDAYLACSLDTSVESLTASMIKEGLVTDDNGNTLKPGDFTIWNRLAKENQ